MNEPRQLHHLVEAHPLLFRGRHPAVMSDLPAGWYDLVDRLCSDIESVLGPTACQRIEIKQIKEKFGALRFYHSLDDRSALHIDRFTPDGVQHEVIRSSPPDPEGVEAQIREVVDAAQAASAETCRVCGSPARLSNVGGWMTTLCETHLAARRAR